MGNDTVGNLGRLLERERATLVGGHLHDLGEILVAKQSLLAQLDSESDVTALAELRRQARRNEALLEAALRGIHAARSRIAEIRQSVLQCDTYTRGGEIRSLRSHGGTTERRA